MPCEGGMVFNLPNKKSQAIIGDPNDFTSVSEVYSASGGVDFGPVVESKMKGNGIQYHIYTF